MIGKASTPAATKEIRQAKGLSRQAFADLRQVKTITVARWERGDVEPKGTAALVLDALLAKRARRSTSPFGSQLDRLTARRIK